MTRRPHEVNADTYRRVFEDTADGRDVLEDLIRRFSKMPSATGIDRILNLEREKGRRETLDFIVAMINRANGVNDHVEDDQASADD
jgi:hypothetical protein